MPSVHLTGFDPSRDVPMLEAWLRRPHVTRWWATQSLLLPLPASIPLPRWRSLWSIAQPVGYLCWQSPPCEDLAAAGLSDLPPDLVDVDILIGEPAFLGQGIGPNALSQLLAKLRAEGVKTVGLAAALANHRALKAYDKAGFRIFRDFHEAGQDMRYLIKTFAGAV